MCPIFPFWHPIHERICINHLLALTCQQRLTAQHSLPSFCVKLSRCIFCQCLSCFSIFQNTDCFILQTTENTKFCRKHQFCFLLTVGCVLQLTRYKRLQNKKKSVRFHARRCGCFIKRSNQDLMVNNVLYFASHPHRSAVPHRLQV